MIFNFWAVNITTLIRELSINLIIMRVKVRIYIYIYMWKEFGIFLSFHYSTIYLYIENNVCNIIYMYASKGFHVLMRHNPKKSYPMVKSGQLGKHITTLPTANIFTFNYAIKIWLRLYFHHNFFCNIINFFECMNMNELSFQLMEFSFSFFFKYKLMTNGVFRGYISPTPPIRNRFSIV